VFAILSVVVLLLTVASGSRTLDTNSVASMAFVADVVFGFGVTAQIVQGARINRFALVHQRTLNNLESLVYEYLVTARVSLPGAVRDRLLQVKKVAASVVEGIVIEDKLRPARVMGIPATPGLLSTAASITASGVVAAFQILRTAAIGGVNAGALPGAPV